MSIPNLHSLSWYHWHGTSVTDFSTNNYVIYKPNIDMVPSNMTSSKWTGFIEKFQFPTWLLSLSLKSGQIARNNLTVFINANNTVCEHLIRTLIKLARGSLSFYAKSWAHKFTKRWCLVSNFLEKIFILTLSIINLKTDNCKNSRSSLEIHTLKRKIHSIFNVDH